MSFADDAYQRINCFALGGWLDALLDRLDAAGEADALAPGAVGFFDVEGLSVTVGRLAAADAGTSGRDARALERVVLRPGAGAPKGLDPDAETPASATAKLSANSTGGSADDLRRGDRRVSYFMPGARVVELTFRESLVGFEQVLIARLGAPLDWRTTSGEIPR